MNDEIKAFILETLSKVKKEILIEIERKNSIEVNETKTETEEEENIINKENNSIVDVRKNIDEAINVIKQTNDEIRKKINAISDWEIENIVQKRNLEKNSSQLINDETQTNTNINEKIENKELNNQTTTFELERIYEIKFTKGEDDHIKLEILNDNSPTNSLVNKIYKKIDLDCNSIEEFKNSLDAEELIRFNKFENWFSNKQNFLKEKVELLGYDVNFEKKWKLLVVLYKTKTTIKREKRNK